MIYQQKEPIAQLKSIIKSFWMVDSEGDMSIHQQKIIPDGYPEMIFHYRDTYKTNIDGIWKLQEKYLIAGQISQFFFLENTRLSGMFAIKFQPWALQQLYSIDMSQLTNRVISINKELLHFVNNIKTTAISHLSFNEKVKAIEHHFLNTTNFKSVKSSKGELIAKTIIDSKGGISLEEVRQKYDYSERSLERYFKTHIGLTPKLYSRVIRFSNVFNLVTHDGFDWADITYLAGFYDQSHFIKNFKEFTGEEPSKYGFTEQNMANFFLKPQ